MLMRNAIEGTFRSSFSSRGSKQNQKTMLVKNITNEKFCAYSGASKQNHNLMLMDTITQIRYFERVENGDLFQK